MVLPIDEQQMEQSIRAAKAKLRAQGGDLKACFQAMSAAMQEEMEEIKQLSANGSSVIPELDFSDIEKGRVTDEQRDLIKKRGCAVIRNTFSRTQAQQWNEQIGEYVNDNAYFETPDKGLDQYFSSLQQGKPQILSVYWSKPQMEARQHENLASARRFLNRLWQYQQGNETIFDPDRECTYADRTRRREPGDNSLGLKPHVDGGSVERWLDDEGFHQVYRHLISGDWESYDPFEAAFRVKTREIPSPAVCSIFRTYQGWTALTPQGPGDGTLQLIPSSRALAWMFLRALQDDVPEDSLCGAAAKRALQCNEEWHSLILQGLSSAPQMQPGDTIWWHPDVIHGVEDQHSGVDYSNVIYIGAAPYCEKNAAYLPKQAERFLQGKSAPDFAAEDYEIAYINRALQEDLTDLGQKQMGLQAW